MSDKRKMSEKRRVADKRARETGAAHRQPADGLHGQEPIVAKHAERVEQPAQEAIAAKVAGKPDTQEKPGGAGKFSRACKRRSNSRPTCCAPSK